MATTHYSGLKIYAAERAWVYSTLVWSLTRRRCSRRTGYSLELPARLRGWKLLAVLESRTE